MNEVRNFFRRCPSCGRRFSIKLTDRKLVREDMETRVQKVRAEGTDIQVGNMYQNPNPQVLYVDVPVTVDVADFQYSYKCGHCGKVWDETHRRETAARK